MKKFKVISDYHPAGDQKQAIDKLVAGLNYGMKHQTLKGVTGSGKTFSMAKIIEQNQLPTLVVSHNKTLAAQLYREFQTFFPANAVEYFVSYYDYYQPEAYVPSRDLYIEKDASINDEIDRLRLSTTSALMERQDVIVVATVSCIYGLGSPVSFRNMRLTFSKGQKQDIGKICRALIKLQYERNDVSLSRGSFRVRGDILEVYPAYMQEAFKLELDWDDLVRIRKIHPLTAETIEELDRVILYPAKHFVLPDAQIRKALDNIRLELEEQYNIFQNQGKIVEAERIKTRTEYDLEMMEEMGYCSGIENYSRQLSNRQAGERPAVLLDYFSHPFLTFIDESHVTLPQVGGMYEGDRSRKLNLVNHGFRLPSALDNRPLFYSEFEEMMDKVIYVTATPRAQEIQKSERIVEQIIRPTGLVDPEIEVRSTEGQVDDLFQEIINRVEHNERCLVTTLTKKMAEDLTDYLSDLNVKVRYLHSEVETIQRVELLRDLRRGIFDVLVGINLLREGLDLPEVSLIAILDADKVGFLRSATSLIQIIGRAARNVNGKVIMYADRISIAMKEAIEETNRRREIQLEYNKTHNITPTTVKKAINDILIRRKDEIKKDETQTLEIIKKGYNILVAKERKLLLKALEKLMLDHAKNLEFEQAAIVRDEIEELNKVGVKSI